MIKGYFDTPGEFRKMVEFDTVPENGSTIILNDDGGIGRYRVRHVAHALFRGDGNAEFRDQMVIVYLSEEGVHA